MIGIVFVGDIIFSPYMKTYTDSLEKNNEDYEVLFWKRDKGRVQFPKNYFYFEHESKLGKSKFLKITDFLKYRRWLKLKVHSKNYDKLIILSTLPGLLLFKELRQDYYKKYIFDIRDYSFENVLPFYNMEKKIIESSCFTCISSPGFKDFLPDHDYVQAHNLQVTELANKRDFKKKKNGPLKLVWIGAVRYFEQQVEIIEKLKDSNQFQIIYHGIGESFEELKDYVEENKIDNVFFTGRYDNKDKAILLQDADILLNSYKVKNHKMVKYAMSNKYYDGLIYGIPQLVERDSTKQVEVEKRKLGIALDTESIDFADRLWNYYFEIDESLFNRNKELALSEIVEEQKTYLAKVDEFILKDGGDL
ncbi:hypothetical protein JZO81_13000 [Enterococcus hulanensis]|uniref:hypothetical protein n=1 Tax=Enterococcus hulanensis TaxID=2559929 RepID=UPI001A937B59|nr:hypothetical protein [Enterococcus hulanensis]MBO0411987.1 hypothetical protein [Enterococcus hulanensis]